MEWQGESETAQANTRQLFQKGSSILSSLFALCIETFFTNEFSIFFLSPLQSIIFLLSNSPFMSSASTYTWIHIPVASEKTGVHKEREGREEREQEEEEEEGDILVIKVLVIRFNILSAVWQIVLQLKANKFFHDSSLGERVFLQPAPRDQEYKFITVWYAIYTREECDRHYLTHRAITILEGNFRQSVHE